MIFVNVRSHFFSTGGQPAKHTVWLDVCSSMARQARPIYGQHRACLSLTARCTMRQATRAARDTLRVRKQSAIRHIPRSCDVFVALTRVVSDAGELDPISGTSERYGRLFVWMSPTLARKRTHVL